MNYAIYPRTGIDNYFEPGWWYNSLELRDMLIRYKKFRHNAGQEYTQNVTDFAYLYFTTLVKYN